MPYLRPAVALVLGFIGSKMILEYFGVEIGIGLSLGVVFSLLAGGIVLSLVVTQNTKKKKGKDKPPDGLNAHASPVRFWLPASCLLRALACARAGRPVVAHESALAAIPHRWTCSTPNHLRLLTTAPDLQQLSLRRWRRPPPE